VGYPELLRVIEDEADREARELRAAAEREAARVLAEARRAAEADREAVVGRARAEAERAVREAEERHALARDRGLLVERRKLLEGLRSEVATALRAATSPQLDAALLAELLPDVGPGPLEVIVDPGAEDAARRALAALDAGVSARATVRAAPAARGGVTVVSGRLVLDDTFPARLARLWPDLEPELAGVLEASPRTSAAPGGGAGEGEAD
jgi:V/A-type H+-transporting ATPase subunit E